MRKLACFCDGVMELELEEGGAGGAELRRGTQKKTFFPGWYYQPGQKGVFLSRLSDPGQKVTPFCPGLAFLVRKPGQQEFPNRNISTFFSSAGPHVHVASPPRPHLVRHTLSSTDRLLHAAPWGSGLHCVRTRKIMFVHCMRNQHFVFKQ